VFYCSENYYGLWVLSLWIALLCTIAGVTVNCKCFHCALHCLVGSWWGCRLEAPSWRHTSWGCGHLVRGYQAWALGRPRSPSHNHLALWLAEAMACRHLAQGLPSLGHSGKTRAPGCSLATLGSTNPRGWVCKLERLTCRPACWVQTRPPRSVLTALGFRGLCCWIGKPCREKKTKKKNIITIIIIIIANDFFLKKFFM
jgi:hypothetical protein